MLWMPEARVSTVSVLCFVDRLFLVEIELELEQSSD